MKKKIIYSFILLLGFSNLVNSQEYKIEKENGTFLLEVTVPSLYYTFDDSVEQCILLIKSAENKNKLIKSYNDSVYLIVDDENSYEYKKKLIDSEVVFDTLSINKVRKIQRDLYLDYNEFKRASLIRFNKNMYYMKFRADISYVNIGKTKKLIPKFENYKCCYSNTEKLIDTKLVLKIENFTLLKK